MEYRLDSDIIYTAYVQSAFDAIDFSGNHTLYVRYAAEGINPFGPDTVLTFTTNPAPTPTPPPDPVTPPAPAVTRDDTLNTVTGMGTGMEYRLDSDIDYTAYDQSTFDAIDFSGQEPLPLYVRFAAEGINPFGPDTVLTFTTNPAPTPTPPPDPVTPPAPAVTRDDTLNTVTGMGTGMEYRLDSDIIYTAYDQSTFDAIDFSGNHTLYVRYAAEGINPFGPDTVLTFTTNPVTPPAPAVTRDDTLNKVTGMSTGMEYRQDSAVLYTAYVQSAFDAIDFSGNHTLYVRYAAAGINPFGPDTVLTFTTNPVTPPAPAVTRDDTLNKVAGITVGMEYRQDSAVLYTAYVQSAFDAIDFSGNHTLYVRYAAAGINPFGPDTVLTFTTNPVTPPAPAVPRDDTLNKVAGMTVGMGTARTAPFSTRPVVSRPSTPSTFPATIRCMSAMRPPASTPSDRIPS